MSERGGSRARRGEPDVVGRDRELAELAAGLEDALGGRGRLFLIGGEPGIGKTCLAEQVARHATERGARVVWGRCWEGGGAPPYWPWAQIVRAVAEAYDDRALTSWLGTGATFVAQIAPDLAGRLGPLAATPVPSIESDAARFYLFEATTGVLKKAAAVQPLVLVFDDLHAADEPSLLLLRYLARELRTAPLLVVGTYRDVDIGRSPGLADALGELVREGQLSTLRGLPYAAVNELIGAIAGGGVAPAAAVVRAVHETTEGNPLFVREAVRLLAAAGRLDQPGRPDVPIPGSVRALIRQRLTPLSADAVQVLGAAAVVGRDFELALVGPACGLPVERVLGAVSEAVALGVLVGDTAGPGRYRFSHSLIREVTYDGLPIPARAGLHRAVGEAIERLYGAESDGHVAELARHFAEVASNGESARALTYARRAGDRAMLAHAYEEAAAEYQRALHALEIAGPDLGGQDDTGPDEGVRCELLLRLGVAQVRAGRYPAAKQTHLQVTEIARRRGSHVQLASAALGFGQPHVEGGNVNRQLVELLREALDALSPEDSPLRARLLARLSLELIFSDEIQLTDPLSRQAVEMARRLGDVAALGPALAARWMAVWGPDGLEERSAVADEILNLAQQTGDRDLELLGRAQRAATSLESGDVLTVETEMAAYIVLADELRMPVHQWTVATMRAMRALLQGSFDEAERLAEEAFQMQPERTNARWARVMELVQLRWEQGRLGEVRETWQTLVDRFPRAAVGRGWLALIDIDRGDYDAARRALEMMAEQIPHRPRMGLWLQGLAVASLVAAELDDADAAHRLYPILLPYAEHVIAMTMEHPVVCFGSSSLYLALLASTASRWAEAAAHFEAAIRVHERLGAAPLLARTRYEYARMLIRRGRGDNHADDRAADQVSDPTGGRARARELLDQAAATARTLGMAGLGTKVARLLEAEPAGAPSATPGAAPAVGRDIPADDVPRAPARDRFQREGEVWTVSFDGSTVRLKDSKGLRQIALLLAQPGRELHATDLESMVGGPAEPSAPAMKSRVAYDEVETRPDFGDAGDLLDAEARAAYKARLDELQEEIDEAEELNDPYRAERAREERELLVRELARAVGLGGRDRRAASHAERARLNATRAIRAAMANLAREHPALGHHLAVTIRTGRRCSYTPDPRSPIRWER